MRLDMAIYKNQVDADRSKQPPINMAGGFLRRGQIVSPGFIYIIRVATARSAVTRKTSVAQKGNMGTGAIRGFFWPTINGRIRTDSRRWDIGIGKGQRHHTRNISRTLHPKVVIQNNEVPSIEIG